MSTVAAARADWGKRSVLTSAPADAKSRFVIFDHEPLI